MLYDTEFKVIQKLRTSDGMGGNLTEPVEVGNIQATVIPLATEVMFSERAKELEESLRLFTEDDLPTNFQTDKEEFTLEQENGNTYSIQSFHDLGREKSLIVRRAD